jgi:hypothetical protein
MLVLYACGPSNPENSALCGFSSVAAATMIKSQMSNTAAALSAPPDQLPDPLPARVTGYGTGRSSRPPADTAGILRFQGNGFPKAPGFGLLLVDDSSEAVRGVLIYEVEAPPGYPLIGGISDGRLTLPLHGLRVRWSAVNDPRCPLFSPPDSIQR